MGFKIFKIGKVKNKEINKLCSYYKTLISKYQKIDVLELSQSCKKSIDFIRKDDALKLTNSVKNDFFNVLLDEKATEFTSVGFSDFLNDKLKYGKNIAFFIPSTFGIDDSFKNKFDFRLSLSKMTFPHEIAYLVLLEQLFRSMKILNNEAYNY